MFYENLPGINVTLKDGGLIIPERGGSESILIIAPSLLPDAPEEPVMVRSSSELIRFGFGDFYVNGEINPIAAEWKAAVDGGAKVVYLAALKEISAEYAAELEASAIADFQVKGGELVAAQAKFNEVLTGSTAQTAMRRKFIHFYEMLMGNLLDFTVDHIVVKGVTLEDEVSDLAGAFFPEVADSDQFPNISGMILSSHVIVSEAVDYPITVVATTSDNLVLNVGGADKTVKIPAKVYDGSVLTIADLASDIQKVIDAGELKGKAKVKGENGKLTFHFTEVAKVGAASTVADFGLTDKVSVWTKTGQGLITRGSFAKTVADFCAIKTLMKSSTLGYIGVLPPIDAKVSTIRKYVDQLLALDTEISPYLQVVASEVGVQMPSSNEVVYLNGATNYAAMIATLRKENAPTNKELKGIKNVRFDYSLRQLSRLTAKKFVTFRVKDNSQLVVTDGITTAPSIIVAGKVHESDFARLSTLRITQLAIEVVREAVEPFIGQENEMPQYNAINTAITSALEKIREARAIQGYKFSVANMSTRLDRAMVMLEIIPAFELRRIEVQVNLAPSEAMLSGAQV